MNISDIEAFLAIVETRNLSKAAAMLFVTQSTISYRLNNLEQALSIRLVERGKGSRTVELTPKGEQMIAIAQRWVSLWKETQQLRERENYIGLTIAQVDWFVVYPFAQIYTGLVTEEPLIKLDIKTGHSMPIYAMVNNMEADVGLVVRAVVSNTTTCKPLFRDPLVLVCSKRMGLCDPVHPRSLDMRNEVFWGYYGDFRFWHDQWWEPTVIPYMTVDFSVPMSFEILKNPSLWVVAPYSVAEEQCRRNEDLAIYHFTNPPPDLIVYMVQRTMPRQNAALPVSIFEQYLMRHIDVLLAGRPYMRF